MRISERSDRLFDELRTEEGKSKAPSTLDRQDSIRPSPQSEREMIDTIQVEKGMRPEWVDGESQQYPSSQYLKGVGYGPNRQLAEDKARAEIAKTFFSKIESQTRSYQEYLQTDSEGKSSIKETYSIDEITELSTQKVLSGVRISHVYKEAGPDPVFYALAVLDRDQSAKILMDKIRKLDQEIQELLNRAEKEEDLLTKIKYLKRSFQEFVLREAHDGELRIVSKSGRGVSAPTPFTEIKSRLESILFRDFLIGISITGNRAREIKEAFVQGLNQQGFSVSEELSRANVLVRGTVVFKILDRRSSEWKYIQWRTHFDLVDKRGGSVFGSYNKNGREGHLTHEQAENRAIQKIRESLIPEIAREMRRYIFFQ